MRRLRALPGIRVALAAVMVLATFASFLPATTYASTPELTMTMVRLNNMNATQTTTGSVCIQPSSSSPNEAQVQVTFPTGFTLATIASGNWTTTNSAPSSPGTGSNYWPSGALGWPSALTASNVTGQTVTFTFTSVALLTSHIYCFDWTTAAALTNPAAATDLQGVVTTQSSVPATIDQGQYALTVVTNDQIVVSAVVPPIFEFVMPGNTDTFTANLSDTSVQSTSGVTPIIRTNAKGGWIMWAKDSNQALNSASSGGTIPSVGWNTDAPSTMTPGTTAAYALSVIKQVAGGTFCTLSVAPEYDTATSGGNGGEFWATFVDVGQCTGGPSNGDGLKLIEEATVTDVTPAATDYTDTITVVGAGLF